MDDDSFVGSDPICFDSVLLSVAPGCSPASSFFNLLQVGLLSKPIAGDQGPICVVLDTEMYNMPCFIVVRAS
jgi:hypothetical protein